MSVFICKRLMLAALAPLAAFMVYGCGGGGGGSSGGGSGSGGGSSSSSASQSSYVAGNVVTVSTRTGVFRGEAATAGLSGGGYAVVWTERSALAGAPDTSGSAILYRLVSATGAMVTAELTANSTTAGDQIRPAVLALDNGGFVVAWEDYSASASPYTAGVIRAQMFDASGTKTGGEFRVNTRALAGMSEVQLAPAGTGFMVAFRERAMNNTSVIVTDEVRAQIYTATGAAVGSELTLKAFPTGSIGGMAPSFSLAGLSDGTFALAVDDFNTSGKALSNVQLFTAQGAPSGSAISLNGGQDAFYTSLVRLTNGRFAAIWSVANTNGYGLRSQAYAGSATYGSLATVNANSALSVSYRGSAGLSGGNYAVLYEYSTRLVVQILTPEGTKPFGEMDVPATLIDGAVMTSGPGGFAIVTTEPNGPNTAKPVVLRLYTRQ